MGFRNPIVGGGGALVFPSIHSPNYVAGVSGWSINKDGTAEFNDAIIRNAISSGTIVTGSTVVINSNGIFVYNGPTRGLVPPTNGGGNGTSSGQSNIPNTSTASIAGGESGQVWTKVSDDGIGTAVFRAIA